MRLGYSDVLTKIGIQSIKDKLIAIESKTVNLQEDKTIELEQQLHLTEV